jgi:hypothetical protein
MANEPQWCNTVFKYPSLSSQGIDWTKPQNDAWGKFADTISDVERLYIRRTWENYIRGNADGKYNFFDKINLSPTYGEYLGFQKLNGTHSQDAVQLTRFSQGDNQYARYLPNPTNIKWVHLPNIFERLKSQIVNIKKEFTPTTVLDENDIFHPLEEEFKLSWMRDLVERGIEGEIGPFYKSPTAKTDSRGLFPFKINQKSLNRFLKYKLDGHSYQKSYLLDFLEDNIKKSNTREWKESKFARPDPDECKLILKHSLNGGQPLTPNNTETFVLTFFAHGKDTGNPINNKWTDIIEPRQFNTNTGRTITVEATGVMPTLGKDNSIKGWIRLPEIFGDLELPWPFVWKFIAKRGIIQKSVWERNKTNPIPVIQIADDLLTRRGINPSTKPSFTENQDEFLRYDARSRFWHFRYVTDDIPDRELMFYIRLYHGAAGAVGARFVANNKLTIPKYSGVIDVSDDELDNIIQCGGVPESGYTFTLSQYYQDFLRQRYGIRETTATILTYEYNNTKQQLRSKYVCLVHDIVGYPRYTVDLESYERASDSNGITLNGSPSQVVDYINKKGRYTFSGGTSDRQPITEDNYEIISFKRSAKIDVQQNHIPLQKLLYKQSRPPQQKSDQDPLDRYVTFHSIISPTTAQFKVSPISKIGITRDIQMYYHSHHVDYNYNFRDRFNPGLLSYKELQFLYELVSYLHYGQTNTESRTIQGSTPISLKTDIKFVNIWEPQFLLKNRWIEIGSRVSMNVSKTSLNTPNVQVDGVSETSGLVELTENFKNSSFLMDYIAWAAPTNEQFNKKKFSEVGDTFVRRYVNKIQSSGEEWKNPAVYPFHALAKEILESENSERPLVPAWVHYKYISRRMNLESKKGRGVDLGIDDNENEIIKRVFGGITDDVNSGVLVALPTFVLGGRVDLGEKNTWDSKWGTNPFSIDSDGKLRVGNLDTVLDKWAQKKKHNGKYVSAMEILFWIRYKHGLSSSPMQRTVEHFLPENATKISTDDPSYNKSISDGKYWPPEASIKKIKSIVNRLELQGGSNTNLKETEILPTETLHNVPILTSYYFPIISDTTNLDQFLRVNADPLIDFETSPQDVARPQTSITGWNSQYVAYWPGAEDVKTLVPRSIFSFSTTFPDISKIRTTFVEPYHIIMGNYRTWENDFGYKKNNRILVTGFESKKDINTASVKSWFRASKLIRVDTEYSIYVANGLAKREGELDSVIAVKGTIEIGNEKKDTNFFISGEPTMQQPTNDYILNDLRRRPWYLQFGDNSQAELASWCDDYALSTKDCMPQYRYMRHLIQPFQFPYINVKTDTNRNGWYSGEQMDLTSSAYLSMWPFHSKLGKDLGTYIEDINTGQSPIKDLAILQSAVLNMLTVTGVTGAIVTATKEINAVNNLLKNSIKASKDILNWGSKTLFWRIGLQTKFIRYSKLGELSGELDAAAEKAKAFDDFKRYGWDVYFNLFKYGLTLLLSIGSEDYIKELKYATIQLGADFAVYLVQNNVLSDTWKHGVEYLIKQSAKTSTEASTQLLARVGSGGHFLIGLVMTWVSLEITAAIEQTRKEEKMDELWGKMNEATNLGFLEGPYLQSNGIIKIPKGVTGIVPLGYEINPATNEVTGTKDVDAKNTRGYGLFDEGVPNLAQRGDEYASYITRKNDEFNKTGGPIDTIGKTMISGSCECEFLLDLISDSDEYTQYLQSGSFQKEEKGTPYNRPNWETGPFRRQFRAKDRNGRIIERHTILDDAPTFEDTPLVYQLSERPNVRTSGVLLSTTLNSNESGQLSRLQLPGGWIPSKYRPRNLRSNIRVNGQNGLFASPQSNPRCPRFWWPTILDVRVSDDLCDYIARNGKYPTKRPEVYGPCDGIDAARTLAISVLTERNQPTDSSAIITDFIGGVVFASEKPLKYTRTAYASGSRIPYTNTFNNDINLTHIRSTNNSGSDTFKRELGNTVFTMEGVDGIATPHEREIVKLFRMKHGIDIVDPLNNCCSLGEVLSEDSDFEERTTLANRQAKANNCTYIIKLNTKRFREKVIERCTRSNQPNKQAEQNEEQRKKESQKVGLTADSEFIDQQVLTQYAQLTDPMSIIIPPGGEQDDDPRRRKSRRKKPCLPGCTDCCDDDNLPPGIEPIEELQRRRADTAVANTPNIPITLAATTGGLVGKGVGSVIGGLVSYILADTNSYRLLGYDITDEIVGGSQETMTMDSTAMNSITVQPKRYIINEIWENSFGERRIVTRNAYTPQERDSILNRYKRG